MCKKLAVKMMVCVVFVASVHETDADELRFDPPFVSGNGSIDMFLHVVSDSSEIKYAGNSSIGSRFSVDQYGKLDLYRNL